MHFILLCVLLGAVIMIPQVRNLVGKGLMLFFVGLLAVIAIVGVLFLLLK